MPDTRTYKKWLCLELNTWLQNQSSVVAMKDFFSRDIINKLTLRDEGEFENCVTLEFYSICFLIDKN